MPSISLVPLNDTPSGRATVQGMFNQARDEAFALFGHDVTGNEGAQFFQAVLLDADAKSIEVFGVALRQDSAKIVGVATLNRDYSSVDEAYIGYLFLDRRYRSMGVGGKAVCELERRASQRTTTISVQVTPPESAAKTFWLAHGYVIDGELISQPHPVTGAITHSARLIKRI